MPPYTNKSLRKYLGVRCLIYYLVILTVVVISSFVIASFLFSSWEIWIDDYNNVDFFDYEERIDAEISRNEHSPKPRIRKDNPNELLDIRDFKLIHDVPNADNFCSHPNGYKFLLVVIQSPRDNYESRKLIRETYGSLRKFRRWVIRPIFIIGTNTSTSTQKLHLESQLHRDILVAHLSENPKDLVYTQVMGYKWSVNHCRTADFVMNAVDNLFIDMFQVIEIISHLHNSKNVMLCQKRRSRSVNRTLVSKTQDTIHIICSPLAVMMSFDLLDKLYFATITAPKSFWIEEVWMTGILREALGVVVIDIGYKFRSTFRKEIEWATNTAYGTNKKLPWVFLSLPRLDLVAEDLHRLWNHTLKVNYRVYDIELGVI